MKGEEKRNLSRLILKYGQARYEVGMYSWHKENEKNKKMAEKENEDLYEEILNIIHKRKNDE